MTTPDDEITTSAPGNEADENDDTGSAPVPVPASVPAPAPASAPTPAPASAPAPGLLAWARSHQNQLVIAGLVLICLILDAIAFRNVQAYEQASGHSLLGLFCVIFIPFTFATPALYYLIFIRRARHELVFVLAGALIGLMLMFVRTPYTWFDENDHAYLALYYADVALGAEHGKTEEGQFFWEARTEDANDAALSQGAFSYHNTSSSDYLLVSEHFFELEQRPGERTTLFVDEVGAFYQYLPSATGILVAQLLHLGKVPTLYLGKLFSLAFYLLVMYQVIRISPARSKTLFCLLGLIPFILSSAGSFSYDNVINVLAFLFIASTLRLCLETSRVRIRDLVVLALLGALLAPLKYVYFPLVFLPLIIPGEKWPYPRFRLYWCAGIFLLGLVSIGVFTLGQTSTELTRLSADQSLNPYYSDAYTLKTFFAHPLTALRVLGYSFFERINLIFFTPTDAAFSSRLPTWTFYLMFLLLVLNSSFAKGDRGSGDRGSGGRGGGAYAVEGDDGSDALLKSARDQISLDSLPLQRHTRLIMLALALAVYLLVLLASINWTPVGAPLLFGAQGRYFIPIIPLLALALSDFIRPARSIARESLYLFCCLGALEVFLTFVSVL